MTSHKCDLLLALMCLLAYLSTRFIGERKLTLLFSNLGSILTSPKDQNIQESKYAAKTIFVKLTSR